MSDLYTYRLRFEKALNEAFSEKSTQKDILQAIKDELDGTAEKERIEAHGYDCYHNDEDDEEWLTHCGYINSHIVNLISNIIKSKFIDHLFKRLEPKIKSLATGRANRIFQEAIAQCNDPINAEKLHLVDKDLRHLMGIVNYGEGETWDCPSNDSWVDSKPGGWNLLQRIAEKNPDLFINAMVQLKDAKIRNLERDEKVLRNHIADYEKRLKSYEELTKIAHDIHEEDHEHD